MSHNVVVADVNRVPSLGAATRFVGSLREAPPGRRSFLGALIRFGVTGCASVAVDVGTLALLHSVAQAPLLAATLGGFAAGVIVNYTLNRNWTFKSDRDHRQTLARYVVLLGVNFALTLSIVLGLTDLGLYYLLSKLIAVSAISLVNFFAGRSWVFVHTDTPGLVVGET